MNILRTVGVVLLLLPGIGFAGPKEDIAWFLKLSKEAQESFIAGYASGVGSGSLAGAINGCANAPQRTPAEVACGIAVHSKVQSDLTRYVADPALSDLRQGVVKFYDDSRNANIALPFALVHVGKSLSGISNAELENDLNRVRNPAHVYRPPSR